MIEIAALAIVASALAGAIFFHAKESQAWRTERADLLNRLMVKNWDEYKALTRTEPTGSITQMTTDAIESAWYEAHAREQAERLAEPA